MENPNTKKIVYDAKKTYVVAHRLNIDIQNIEFDVMLASYIIDPSRTIDDVNSVVTHYGQHYVQDNITIYGKGKSIMFLTMLFLISMWHRLQQPIFASKTEMESQLKEYNQVSLLADIELPLARILSQMEEIGIYTDAKDLQQMEKEIQEKLDILIKNIHEAGEEFNINSPKQLGVVLFETLQLPVIKN